MPYNPPVFRRGHKAALLDFMSRCLVSRCGIPRRSSLRS